MGNNNWVHEAAKAIWEECYNPFEPPPKERIAAIIEEYVPKEQGDKYLSFISSMNWVKIAVEKILDRIDDNCGEIEYIPSVDEVATIIADCITESSGIITTSYELYYWIVEVKSKDGKEWLPRSGVYSKTKRDAQILFDNLYPDTKTYDEKEKEGLVRTIPLYIKKDKG